MSSPLEFWSWSSSIPSIPSPTLFSDEKKRSRKDFERLTAVGKVQSQDEIWGQSNWVFSLNDDEALFESRVRGHDLDLGDSLDARLCSQHCRVQIMRETSDWRGLPEPALVHKWFSSR